MRVSVTRTEETSFVIEHGTQPLHGVDLSEIEDFVEELHEAFGRPQCCVRCMDEDDDFMEGECPCPIAMSSL